MPRKITKIRQRRLEREISGVMEQAPMKLDENGVRRVSPRAGANILFLRRWAKTNEGEFTRVMKAIAIDNPVKWAQIFMQVQDKIVPQKTVEKTIATKIDVKVNEDSDMNRLQALAGGQKPSSLLGRKKYTDYEEVLDDDDD